MVSNLLVVIATVCKFPVIMEIFQQPLGPQLHCWGAKKTSAGPRETLQFLYA